jgi:outer membrane lipoprotein SlyB
MISASRSTWTSVVLVVAGLAGLTDLSCAQDGGSSSTPTLVGEPRNQSSGAVYSTHFPAGDCTGCARVTAITVAEKPADDATLGMVAGGVVGAVLGRQIGAGRGKDVATIAGAVGGAYAGKKIQENMGRQKSWTVSVTYSDGQSASFDFQQDPGFAVGDSVKSVGKTLVRQ